jgi:hypothetical protein
LDEYLATQLAHHPMADERVAERFQKYQVHHSDIDLTRMRHTSHAIFPTTCTLCWRRTDGGGRFAINCSWRPEI